MKVALVCAAFALWVVAIFLVVTRLQTMRRGTARVDEVPEEWEEE